MLSYIIITGGDMKLWMGELRKEGMRDRRRERRRQEGKEGEKKWERSIEKGEGREEM